MTTHLANIRPWEPYIVPGVIDPRYRLGSTINPEGIKIVETAPPPTTQKIESKPGLGENNIIKQLVNVLQKSQTTEKMTEAIPDYRRL